MARLIEEEQSHIFPITKNNIPNLNLWLAKLRDTGFQDARLESLGEGLKPGSSAIVAVVEHTWVTQAQAAMEKAGGDLVVASISEDISKQLEAGNEVAYTAIATQQGLGAARVAGGKDQLEAEQIVVNDSGVYGSKYVATKDGFEVIAVDETV